MALEKHSSTADFDFQVEPVSLVEQPSDLVKRAAAEGLKIAAEKGQTDVHVIALGSNEGYGANRNSDLFSEKDCVDCHPSFLKAGGMANGRGVCRNHKNKKSDPRYGNIKQSAYNHKMRRIELVLGLDNDKCAEEIQKLAEHKQVAFSMACKVDGDRCTECHHFSKTGAAEDRCDCINNHLGEITKKGNYIGMENPHPNWFELSIVGRPADRIAYSIKNASAILHKSACVIGEITQVPDSLKISKFASDKMALVRKLSAIEKHIMAAGVKHPRDKLTASQADRPSLSKETIEELRGAEPGQLLKTLADNGIVFSPSEFMQYLFSGKSSEKHEDGMRSHLPGIFGELEKKHGGESANNERYEPSHHGKVKGVDKLKDGHSFFNEPSQRRVMQIVIMSGFKPKEAMVLEKTPSALDRGMAEQYAAYKLATVKYLDDNNKLDDGFLERVVWQNLHGS